MRDQRGVVLVIALLIMVVLSLLGVTFLTLSLHEHNVALNYVQNAQAFHWADGGLAVVQQQLKGEDDWVSLEGATFDCSDGEFQCAYTFTQMEDDFAVATVEVSYRRATGWVQAGFRKFVLPIPEGGLTSLGQSSDVAFNGNAFTIDGNNWVPPTGGNPESQDNLACAGSTPVPKFGIAVKDAAAQATVYNDLTAQQRDNVTGAAPNPPGISSSIGVDSVLTQADVLTLVDNLETLRHDTYPAGTQLSSETIGTQTAPKIVVVEGDLTLSASSGAGVLIVRDGTLRMSGSSQWIGLVLLVGANASLDVDGGGDKAIYGSVIVAEMTGSATEVATAGGNLKIRYSCDGLDVARLAAQGSRGRTAFWTSR